MFSSDKPDVSAEPKSDTSITGEELFKQMQQDFFIAQVVRFKSLIEFDLHMSQAVALFAPKIPHEQQWNRFKEFNDEVNAIDDEMKKRKTEFTPELVKEYQNKFIKAIENYRDSNEFQNKNYEQHTFEILLPQKDLVFSPSPEELAKEILAFAESTHKMCNKYRDKVNTKLPDNQNIYIQINKITYSARAAASILRRYLHNLNSNKTLSQALYTSIQDNLAILQKSTDNKLKKLMKDNSQFFKNENKESSTPSTDITEPTTSTTPKKITEIPKTTTEPPKTEMPKTPETSKATEASKTTEPPKTSETSKTTEPPKKSFFSKPDSGKKVEKTSTVEKLPDGEPKYTLQRPNKFISKHNVEFIEQLFQDNGHNWTIQNKQRTKTNVPFRSVVDKDNNEKFAMFINKLTTKEDDDATFRIMLKTFKEVHADSLPKITTSSPTIKNRWERIFKEVYPEHKEGLDTLIVVKDAKLEKETPGKKH